MLKRLLVVSLAAASIGVVAPTGADATTMLRWYGTVTRVVDGDTVMVDVAGDGLGAVPIRNAALQTTELNRSTKTPECHAQQAYTRMEQLLPVGTRVRLSAYRADSTSGVDAYGATRYVRYIDAYNTTTASYSTDVQSRLIREGHGVWKPEPVETSRQAWYHHVMQLAMHEGHNIWDDHTCGDGPAAGAQLRMWINYEADGIDTLNLTGEHVKIMNTGTTDISLAGWKLRDTTQKVARTATGAPLAFFTFPTGTVVAPGGTLTLYPTAGVSDGKSFYLNEPTLPFFPNVANPALGYPGKSMFLLDPALDFRATADYPCLVYCAKPAAHISTVSPLGSPEYVDLQVDAGVTAPIDLTGAVVSNDGWVKEIEPGTKLVPGKTLRIYCEGAGTDSQLTQYWLHVGNMLEDAGDTVVLRTATATVLSSYSYGTG